MPPSTFLDMPFQELFMYEEQFERIRRIREAQNGK